MYPPTYISCDYCCVTFASLFNFRHPRDFTSHTSRRGTLYIYILLSPGAERPPSRLLAHSGARYEMSDLREIVMAWGDETPRARQGGGPRARGRSPRPSIDVCAEPLHLEGSPETRGVPSSGAGPSQNGTCLGSGIDSKIRAGRSTVNYFGFGRTRVCIRQSVCTE